MTQTLIFIWSWNSWTRVSFHRTNPGSFEICTTQWWAQTGSLVWLGLIVAHPQHELLLLNVGRGLIVAHPQHELLLLNVGCGLIVWNTGVEHMMWLDCSSSTACLTAVENVECDLLWGVISSLHSECFELLYLSPYFQYYDLIRIRNYSDVLKSHCIMWWKEQFNTCTSSKIYILSLY